MANALASLGYSVHDFEEHLEYNFFEGSVGSEIFTDMYSAVDAVLDQPSCNLANILLQQFPDAKVSKESVYFIHLGRVINNLNRSSSYNVIFEVILTER